MVAVKLGYYVQDSRIGGEADGQDYVSYYFMGAEPPDEQYIFRGGAWKPLIDGYYLMDKIIDGDPDVDGPFDDPPEGVPPFESRRGRR
jgi:hypothetical protein